MPTSEVHQDVVDQAKRFGGIGIRIRREWRIPQATAENLDPSTGRSLGTVAVATAENVDSAVEAARAAIDAWRALPPQGRAEYVEQLAHDLLDNIEDLAQLEAVDTGNPLHACRFDVRQAAAILRYTAGLALELKGETTPTRRGVLNYTLRQPYGVVARITAFNHPVLFAAKALGSPLVAGNTVIIKPSPWTPLSTTMLAEIADAVLPPGVVGLLTGGADTATDLVRHRDVRRVSFVGSVTAGLALTRAAAEVKVTTLTLELGGKNPMIVFPDVDVALAARAGVDGMNFTSTAGQSCGSTSRILVHRSLYEQFVDHLVEGVAALSPGPPLDPATTMGPLVNEHQLEKTRRYVAGAVRDGARLRTGGAPVDDPALDGGYFHEPTVFQDVRNGTDLASHEVFGPIVAVMPWDSREEALQLANSLDGGLTASIWTNDLADATTFARDVEAGYVWVNGVSHHQLGAPFGGVKDSGTSRADWLGDLLSYTQIKNVNVDLPGRPA